MALEREDSAYPVALDFLSGLRIQKDGLDPEKRKGCGTRLQRSGPGKGSNENAACLGLPPGIDDRTSFLSGISMIPSPSLGVNRFADAAKDTQAGHLVFARPFLPGGGNCPDRCGRSVKLIDLPLLDHLPIPVRVRVSRNAFEHGRCGSIGQGTINDVRMPGNPTDVSRAK